MNLKAELVSGSPKHCMVFLDGEHYGSAVLDASKKRGFRWQFSELWKLDHDINRQTVKPPWEDVVVAVRAAFGLNSREVGLTREELAEIMRLEDPYNGLDRLRNNLRMLDQLGLNSTYPLLILLKELEDLPPEVATAVIQAIREKRRAQRLVNDEF